VETVDVNYSSSTSVCSTATAPTTSNTTHIASLDTTIVPLSTSSTILVEFGVYVSPSTSGSIVAALFRDAGASALAAGCVTQSNVGGLTHMVVAYKVASASLVSTTFKMGLALNQSGTAYYNSTAGAAILFGGTLGSSSYMKITEYI